MKTLILVFCSLVVSLMASPLELQEAPSDHIYDPNGILDEDFRASISKRIKHELLNENLEVFLVLFGEEPREGARAIAKTAAQNWAQSNYWAVVFQVGFDGSPSTATGGKMMSRLNPKAVESGVQAAETAGGMVEGRQSRLEEYVNTLTNQFGYLRVVAGKVEAKAYREQREKIAAKNRGRKRMLLLSGLGALGLLAIGILSFVYQKRSKKRAKKTVTFPDFEPRMRLAGPHTGGSSVVVHFGTSSQSR